MSDWRRLAAFFSLILLNCKVVGCRSPNQGAGGAASGQEAAAAPEVSLPGVDTSALTGRERRQWSGHVSALPAPCDNVKATLKDCVKDGAACSACLPAAKYLVSQVRAGLTTSQVENAYRGRFSADGVRAFDIADSPFKGSETASVVLIEFADFECPACQMAAPVVDEVVAKYSNDLKFVFKNFPLPIHANSEMAARSAVAAGRQGKFWEMHHALFKHGAPLDRAVIDSLAKDIGLSAKQFTADLESEAVADLVSRDRKQGEQAELKGTPSLFINGRRFESSTGLKDDLDAWISLEIELQKGKAAQAAQPATGAATAPAPSSK